LLMLEYKENFTGNLKKLYGERKLTQKKLADIIGVDQPAVSNLLNGVSAPKFATLINIADYFGVSIDWLVGRTENPDVNV